MSVVLDASALLAFIHGEPGGASVEQMLAESSVSAVNWSEVAQKTQVRGVNPARLRQRLEEVGVLIIPLDAARAEQAASLWPLARNLSLADRACLALGIELGVPVWTTDRAWAAVATGAEVRVIR